MVFTEYEQELLKQMSAADGVSESAFLRALIRDTAKNRGLWNNGSLTEAQAAKTALDEKRGNDDK